MRVLQFMKFKTIFYLAGMVLIGFSTIAVAQENLSATCSAGQPLDDVLSELQDEGARFIYSSELIKDWMRVPSIEENEARYHPIKFLKQLLIPFGLDLRLGGVDIWSVVSNQKYSDKERPRFIRGVSLHALTGKPISGAYVSIESVNVSTITMEDGCFSLAVPATGEYTLQLDAEGYKSKNIPFYVSSQKTLWLKTRLESYESDYEYVDVLGTHRLEPVKRARPAYPAKARRAGVAGYALMEFTISANGTIEDPQIVEAYPAGFFEEHSLLAVKRLRYRRYKVGNKQPPPINGVRYTFRYIYKGQRI